MERDLMRLRQGSHYLKTALDQVSEGVMILMPQQDGGEPYVMHGNAQAHILMGVDPGAGLRERTLSDLAADEASAAILREALQRALKGGGSTTCECALRAGLGGTAKSFRWQVRAVTNEHGVLLNYTVCFRPVEPAASVADGGAGEEDLDAQAARLRTETMAALAQGIAHDVNNLLGPMMTQLSVTLQRVQEQPELQAELQMMFAALKRARQFTQQVVKAAKTRQDERAPTNLMPLVKDTVSVCAAGANVEVVVGAERDLMWVQADAVRMTQVLQNLVMNGMQAMPGGGRLFIEMANVVVEAGNAEEVVPGKYVEVRVRDRGVGMAPETLAKLFKESFTTKHDGNGIGLTTCHRFVRDHGGHIAVSSTLNVGTEFRILLPAVPPQQCSQDASASAPIPLQNGEGRVMLVDDEDALRHVARCILTRCGYEVVEVDNGEDAVRLYKEAARRGEAPDVVLMDLTLRGGLSGSETAREILAFDPSAKLVVTSGSVTEEVQRVFLDDGFAGVLPKPYEAGALTVKVREMMELNAEPLRAAA
jgi:signal transduction histidine kinase/ActR/RegA family two-component response regulator